MNDPFQRSNIPAQPVPPVYAPRTWKTELKRILLGIVWFLVLWIVSRMLIGAVIGGMAGAHLPQGGSGGVSEGYQQGYAAGQTAALQFFQQYGLLIMLGALALAVAGTLTGFLPGTGRARLPRSYPPPPGQWPQPPAGPGQWPPSPGGPG